MNEFTAKERLTGSEQAVSLLAGIGGGRSCAVGGYREREGLCSGRVQGGGVVQWEGTGRGRGCAVGGYREREGLCSGRVQGEGGGVVQWEGTGRGRRGCAVVVTWNQDESAHAVHVPARVEQTCVWL